MSLRYLSRTQLRSRLDGSAPALTLLWSVQHLAWMFLRLEAPAWQSLEPSFERAFPQFHRYHRWRIGDPLRLLIQAAWISIVRLAPSRSAFRLWLAQARRQHLAAVRERLARGRSQYERVMQPPVP